MNILKKLLCKHEFEFRSNEYGDRILEGGFHRSNWFCKKCGQWKGKPFLVYYTKPIIQENQFE